MTRSDHRTILISINTSWNIYNFRATLISELKAQGYRVVSAAPDDAYTARLGALVDDHISLPIQNCGTSVWHDLMLFLRYLRLLVKLRPAVMLTYTIKPNIYGSLAAALLGIPVIANISGLGTVFIHRNWLGAIVRPLYRFALCGAACIFFQNPEDRDLFIRLKLVNPAKAALIAGSGVDLDYFNPGYAAKRDPAAPVAFVLIARLLWDKGIGEFVAAARMVKAAYPQTMFRLVGPRGVPNRTSIPDAVIEHWIAENAVEYQGETDNVRDVIAQHDCVVLPSYREGMSRVLLEAAAMGKPLITTDVAGCRQVVGHEVNGLLCAPADAQSLANAMIRFLHMSPAQREQMGAQSRTKAQREFDQKQVLAAYCEKIAELI